MLCEWDVPEGGPRGRPARGGAWTFDGMVTPEGRMAGAAIMGVAAVPIGLGGWPVA